jgi:hypothetical protein
MKIAIIIICIFLSIYILVGNSFLLKNRLAIKKNINIKSYDLFTYNFAGLCQAPFEYDKNSYKTCTSKVFNGFQIVLLEWVNNPDKNNLICYYTMLASNYLNAEGKLYYSNNYWLTVYDKKKKETIGTARWSNCYKNNLRKKITNTLVVAKANVPFSKSVITATSGILEKYQNANILTEFVGDDRFLHIYTGNSYVNKKYEEYKSKNLLETKIES